MTVRERRRSGERRPGRNVAVRSATAAFQVRLAVRFRTDRDPAVEAELAQQLAIIRRVRPRRPLLQQRAFEAEQLLLALEPAAVADEAARRADDAVAGKDDRHRVAVHHRADGAGRPRVTRPARRARRRSRSDRRGRGRAASSTSAVNGAAPRRSIDRSNERRRPAKYSSSSRRASSTLARSTEHTRPGGAREPLELLLGIGVEVDRAAIRGRSPRRAAARAVTRRRRSRRRAGRHARRRRGSGCRGRRERSLVSPLAQAAHARRRRLSRRRRARVERRLRSGRR